MYNISVKGLEDCPISIPCEAIGVVCVGQECTVYMPGDEALYLQAIREVSG